MAHISKNHIRILAILCLGLLLAALFIGGRQPGAGSLFPVPWDKVVHLTFYGTLTILAGIALPKIKLPVLFFIIVSIGGTDELLQIYIPGRHAGFDDLAADGVGCLIALFLVPWLTRKLDEKLNKANS
jgi:VanZ family protein